ncbi:MAG: hypothetical protein P8X81_10130 [Woeseiaceae bacterium]|jgi:hypothetical protein
MTRNSWTRLRGIVPPVLGDEPVIIQLCRAFVANLRIILNVAMLFGAFFLAQELRESTDNKPVAVVEPGLVEDHAPPDTEPTDDNETSPVLTDGVLHALNCTYEDYRKDHYAECVEDGSEVYRPIEADSDDTGHLYEEQTILLASISR